VWLESPDGCYPSTCPLSSTGSLQPLLTTQGYHLGYNQVKVTQEGNGYSVYTYYGTDPQNVDHSCVAITNFNSECNSSIPNYPSSPLPNDFKRGLIKTEAHFNNEGNCINQKEYYYNFIENPVGIPGYIFVHLDNTLLAAKYELKTAKKTYTKIVERTYSINSSIPMETSIESFYESPYHHQVTRTLTVNSKGEQIETKIKYSSDFIAQDIANINTCNINTYASVDAGFPLNYLSQLAICDAYIDVNRNVCIGNVWYSSYIKNISNARLKLVEL